MELAAPEKGIGAALRWLPEGLMSELGPSCTAKGAVLANSLTVEVVQVRGSCPLYECGDRFCIEDGFALVTRRRLCMHALQAIAPYYVALSRGILPADLGLAGPDGAAYLQCLDPQGYTGGGTVVFRVSRAEV